MAEHKGEGLHLEVVTPERMVLDVHVDWVTVPGSEGELGLLPEHIPLMTALESGVLSYGAKEGDKRMALHDGYAQLEGNTVTVLAQLAEPAETIDLARAQEAERKVREALAVPGSEETHIAKHNAKLKRALVRQSAVR